MSSLPTYHSHITSSDDLVTPYEATRAGFVALALEKNRKATPFVAEARALKVAASQAKTPKALLKIESIKASLLTAAGVSDKAVKHLTLQDHLEAIQGLIESFLEPAGRDFVEEFGVPLSLNTRRYAWWKYEKSCRSHWRTQTHSDDYFNIVSGWPSLSLAPLKNHEMDRKI